MDSSGHIEKQKIQGGSEQNGGNRELIGAAQCGFVGEIRQGCGLSRDNSERVSTVI